MLMIPYSSLGSEEKNKIESHIKGLLERQGLHRHYRVENKLGRMGGRVTRTALYIRKSTTTPPNDVQHTLYVDQVVAPLMLGGLITFDGRHLNNIENPWLVVAAVDQEKLRELAMPRPRSDVARRDMIRRQLVQNVARLLHAARGSDPHAQGHLPAVPPVAKPDDVPQHIWDQFDECIRAHFTEFNQALQDHVIACFESAVPARLDQLNTVMFADTHRDQIVSSIARVPVKLPDFDQVFDLKTLLTLEKRENPYNRQPFSYRDIQAAPGMMNRLLEEIAAAESAGSRFAASAARPS